MPQLAYETQAERPMLLGALADNAYNDVVSLINEDPAAKQVDTFTVANYVAAKVYSWSFDGVARSYTATVADANNNGVAASIVRQMNSDPLFSGRMFATAIGAVITATARVAGRGWTALGGVDFVLANVTANATADAVPYGRLVLDGGQLATGEKTGIIAKLANLLAQQAVLTPSPVAGAGYEVDVEVDDRTYRASYDTDLAGRAVLATGVVGNNNAISWTARDSGPDGENVSVEILDPGAVSQPLWLSVANNRISVYLATNGAGAITSTAAQVIAAIQAGQAAAAKASSSVGAGDAGIRYTSRLEGRDGNGLSVAYVDPAANSQPLWLERDANNILVVHLATNDAGAIITTAQEILDIIQEGGRDVPSQGITGTVAANNAIIWRSALQGEAGRRVSVSLTDAAAFAIVAPAEDAAGEVVVEVQYRGAANGNVDRAPEIVAGVMANAQAQRWLTCEECPGSTGAGNVPAVVAQRLDTVSRISDDVTDLVSVALLGAGTGTVVAAIAANLAGGVPDHTAGELASVANTGASTGAGVMVAAAAANLAIAAVTAQVICDALVAQLNAQLPVQTVLAATVGAGAAGTLRLTSELAGKPFRYAVGSDDAAATWAVTSDNSARASDISQAARGVAVREYSRETNSETEPGYPANSTMSVLRNGRVVVHTEAEIDPVHQVYVRVADTLATSEPVGAFTDVATVDCIKLDPKRFRWAKKLSSSRAVLQINCD